MSTSVALAVWQSAVEGGAMDLASDGMGLPEVAIIDRTDLDPRGHAGRLHSPHRSERVGAGRPRLDARGLPVLAPRRCSREPGLSDITSSDVSDALGEAVNILAGFVKRSDPGARQPARSSASRSSSTATSRPPDRVRAAVTHIQRRPVKAAAALVVLRAAQWKAVPIAA